MYKTISIILIACLIGPFVGCAKEKKVCISPEECYTFEPYGLFDGDKENPNVDYDASVGNIILSIIFCETIVVPVILMGWYLFEPTGKKKVGGVPGAIER